MKINKNVFFRIVGIAGFLLLSLNLILHFLGIRVYDSQIDMLFVFLLDIYFFIVIFYPYKLEYLSFICFLLSARIIISEEIDFMGIAIYHLAIIALFARGYFYKNKNMKLIILFFVYISLITLKYFLFPTPFIYSIVNHIGMNIVLILIEFFVNLTAKNYNNRNSVLNLNEFDSLKKRDADWLIMIQQYKSYKEIAKEYYLTDGSVRNRINQIYETIGVKDKQDFLFRYGKHKILFETNNIDPNTNNDVPSDNTSMPLNQPQELIQPETLS